MIQIVVWFTVLILAALSGAMLAGQFVLGRRSPRTILASTLVLLLIYCMLGAEAVGAVQALESGWTLLRNLGVLLATAVLVTLQLAGCRWLIQNRSPRGKFGLGALVACHLLMVGPAGWQFYRAVALS